MILKTKMGMAFLKLLLCGCLIIAAMGFRLTENSRNKTRSVVRQTYRLPDDVFPLHYNIKLMPHIKENYYNPHDMFEGESTTRIYVYRKTRDIFMHKLDLYIYNTLTTLINEGNGKIYKPVTYRYNHKTHIFILHFVEELSSGLYTLNMKFLGIQVHTTEGFLKTSYTNDRQNTMWLNTTHFQAIGARRVFPCWDEPAFKTTFNISILHHQNYTALSNMPIQDTEYTNNSMVWTHFHTTPVMSTYFVVVAVTNFPFHRINTNILERQTMWCRLHSKQYTKLVQSVSKTVTAYLKANWKSLKAIPKIDLVIIPEFQNISNWHFQDGVSKWGLIFYRETRITYNEQLDPVAHKIEVTRLVAHEVTHHWFSNLVSPSWWSSLWINDGIARLLAADTINKTVSDSRMLDLFVVQIQRASLNLDTYSLMKPLAREINTTADINSLINVPYIKAPAIFRMLQHILTDVVFRKGIDRYLNAHQLGSANADDLWTAIQIALTESNYEYKFDIKHVMDAWITQSHYPVLNVKRDYESNNIIISYENGNGRNKWWIPVTYTTQTELNFTNTWPSRWLGPNTQNVTLFKIHSNNWIILNLQQTGYYRVNYDPTIWRRIARYLNSGHYVNIHVLNRAQIIDDAFYLAIEKKSNFSIFWELGKYLSRETDYVAWYPMIKAFEYLSTFILFSNVGLEEKMHKLLPVLLMKLGYQENPNENDLNKCLKQEITKWACTLGDSDCRNNALTKLKWHLDNPEKHKILPWWKDWTFCKGLIKADSSVWMKMMDMYKEESNNKILEYLTCSEDSNIIQMYLELISSDDNIIKIGINDRINVFLYIIAKHAKNNKVFEYILENFEKIKPRQISTVAALIVILNHGYIKSRQNMILSKFAKNNLKKERILKTIQYKSSRREKRLKMIQEIMSNDLKEDVVTSKEKHYEIPQEKIVVSNDLLKATTVEHETVLLHQELREISKLISITNMLTALLILILLVTKFKKLINPILENPYITSIIQYVIDVIDLICFIFLFFSHFFFDSLTYNRR